MKKTAAQLIAACKGTAKKVLAYGTYFATFRPAKKNGKWMRRPCSEELFYDAMTFDINNTCNLRCRFCFNDFENKAFYMTEAVYRKILALFPMIRPVKRQGAGILFSCLYEPSIAPDFLKFLKLLPRTGRKNVFFTSNFSRSMTEEEIRTILSANIRHVNLSVETLRPERYHEICASVQFDRFYRNLEKIALVNAKWRPGRHRAKLYCITMVLKENRDELSAIGKFCAEKLRAARHEFRTPYISAAANHGDWNMGQLMNEDECSQVRRELMALRVPLVLDIHSKDELFAGAATPPKTAHRLPLQQSGHGCGRVLRKSWRKCGSVWTRNFFFSVSTHQACIPAPWQKRRPPLPVWKTALVSSGTS
ncbi:MAG: radical SAM protein [Lachnospiraceae bacterium]|nr:radical SAM protein [uncultured Acetatifactor sp.]MCI9218123.1 radical SAM protein [Lachnospiraceae bacterium]